MSSSHALVEGIFHRGRSPSTANRLVVAGQIISDLHPHAIDYIQQAPVIVLPFVNIRASRESTATRVHIRDKLGSLLQRQPKLRELMEELGLAYQLRTLYGCNLRPFHWDTLRPLNTVNPSTLAQAIPVRIGHQALWLHNLHDWVTHMRRRAGEPVAFPHLEWIVAHATTILRYGVNEIADLALASNMRTDTLFNPRWTAEQAYAAAQRWHAELARSRQSDGHKKQFGMEWDAPVDYGKLPLTEVVKLKKVGEYQFVALRSAEELHREGQTMHNCVSSYFSAVHGGRCRIYSVRKGDVPVATLELVRAPHPWFIHSSDAPLLPEFQSVAQLKGPCNAQVDDDTHKAVREFVKRVKAIK